MPIYAFACNACGHHFDHLQRLSDVDPDTCPHCGKKGRLHRELTAPQFRLAGSGWYETDFKSKGEHRHNLAGDGGKTSEGKKETASESKPAATSSSGE
ncbi:zinc ribbon domain-containing protein [Thermomonas sp.]|uniref:FmdB family zinc ribbon protein n=1 Tax=Thermomonas sp. TaxID=1971895 RepID=UPI00260FAFC1|nr:zinc ribbon domain-containing protein [Thermomonas sp.]